jgi:hypothetical protein
MAASREEAFASVLSLFIEGIEGLGDGLGAEQKFSPNERRPGVQAIRKEPGRMSYDRLECATTERVERRTKKVSRTDGPNGPNYGNGNASPFIIR